MKVKLVQAKEDIKFEDKLNFVLEGELKNKKIKDLVFLRTGERYSALILYEEKKPI